MNEERVRVRLYDPEERFLEDIRVPVERDSDSSDLDVRRQIADHIETQGRYYLYEDDSIFAAEGPDCDYWATVHELRTFGDRCPNCGDQSDDVRASAATAVNEGGRGVCPQCGIQFRIAAM